MRFVLTFLFILFLSPAYAGIYEDAVSKNNDVLLYLYSPYCRACNTLEPYYDGIIKTHKELKAVKVNAETLYGNYLMRKFKGIYVPYIVLYEHNSRKNVSIEISCLADDVCFERVLKNVRG